MTSANVAGLHLADFCDYCGWMKPIVRVVQQGKKMMKWCGCVDGKTATTIDTLIEGRPTPRPTPRRKLRLDAELRTWFTVGLLLGIGIGLGTAMNILMFLGT